MSDPHEYRARCQRPRLPWQSARLSNSSKGTYHGHAFSVQSISHPRRNLNGQNTLGSGLSFAVRNGGGSARDRKSTRLNSSHGSISYAVFCLKKKKIKRSTNTELTNYNRIFIAYK